ncbi:hypothetical protein, partial [Staphylococcus epidermidis]|uniref:hypothetical protein n=1 Tax=Staphylococcus epidermidis TaxID=1282 RepID=UPI0011A99DC0
MVIVGKVEWGGREMEKEMEEEVWDFEFGMVVDIYCGYVVVIGVVYFDYGMNLGLNLLLVFG